MTGRQIPSEIWQRFEETGEVRFDLTTFMEAAGLQPTQKQSVHCVFCLKEGETDAPEAIVYIKGTSYCINHSKNMLN